jgi:hypothetical protein
LANLGAAMPALPDRTSWLTLDDANEAAVRAWKEKKISTEPGRKQSSPEMTTLGDISVEIEAS